MVISNGRYECNPYIQLLASTEKKLEERTERWVLVESVRRRQVRTPTRTRCDEAEPSLGTGSSKER